MSTHVPRTADAASSRRDFLQQAAGLAAGAAALTTPLAAADALIVDLRDGWGGGSAEYLNLFNNRIPRWVTTGRDGDVKGIDTQWRKPVALLVDENTRSGKELLAWGFLFSTLFWTIVLPWWSFPGRRFEGDTMLLGRLSSWHAPLWLLVAGLIYVVLFGWATPTSVSGFFTAVFTTPPGWVP